MSETGDPKRSEGNGSPSGTRTSPFRNPILWALLAGIAALILVRPLLQREPPPPALLQLPAYTLTDHLGRSFGSAELAGHVYVANFFFTRCKTICPVLTRAMADLERRYDEAGVEEIRLVSFSVDPEHDTPERLRRYIEDLGLDTSRWTLVTGSPEAMRSVVVGGFKAGMGEPPSEPSDLFEIAHSAKLALVDREGEIRGYYDCNREGLDEIFRRSIRLLEDRR